jgi:hypothetical protein
MKINLKVLQQLAPVFGVGALQSNPPVQKILNSGTSGKASANYEPILTGAGYEWSDERNAYSLGDQIIYFFPAGNVFLWTWTGLFRGLKGGEMITKWVQGDEKYPEGKANKFMGTYKNMTGQDGAQGGVATAEPEDDEEDRMKGATSGDISFSGTGDRGAAYASNPAPVAKGDETDLLISKLKKQVKSGTLPSDLMIDLGLKAKKDNNGKLLAFLKTVRPVNENTIKRSQLNTLVREIIKGIIKEGWEDDNEVLGLARQAWGQNNWRVQKSRKSEHGTVYQLSFNQPISRFLWKTNDGSWKALDPKTKKWNPVQGKVGEMTGTGAVSPVMTPNAFKKTKGAMEGLEPLGGMEEEGKIDEMTTTGDVSGYNIPAAFSKRGGSQRGVKGSESLGYTLTPQGKKEMNRTADKLYQEGK